MHQNWVIDELAVIQQLTLWIDGDVVSVCQDVSRFLGDKRVFIVDVGPNQRQCQVIGSGSQCSKSRRSVLLLRHSGPIERGWGRSHVVAWWDFWQATSRSTPVAYVLWVILRYNFLLPWSAEGISRMVAGIVHSCDFGFSAVGIPDLSVCPSSPDKRIPEGVGGGGLRTMTVRVLN
jgi:hypothetical protein